MSDGQYENRSNGPPRFCPECDFGGYTKEYYCPECDTPFFPNAKPGSKLRPRKAVTDGGVEEDSAISQRGERLRYCCRCDQTTAEWGTDANGVRNCPACGSPLHDSREAYFREMEVWLLAREGMTSNDVTRFLLQHGNPSKEQAAAILEGSA